MIKVNPPFDKTLSEGKNVKVDIVSEIVKVIPDRE